MKMYLKLTLNHELAIASIFLTQKARREAKSTKFKVTPDTTVMHACVCRLVEHNSFECDVFSGPCHWNTNLILMEINKHAANIPEKCSTFLLLHKF